MPVLTRFIRLLLCTLLASLLGACDSQPPPARTPAYRDQPGQSSTPVYRLAVHPLHNPAQLVQAYQPLLDRINAAAVGWQLELEASRDYQDYERKFRARGPDILLPNPWHTLQAIKQGYHVIAMAGDKEDFRGIFVVRRDSKIRQIADLRGKILSYPSHTALAACIMPQYFLHTHGINVRRDIRNVYVGSQESAIVNVYLGTSDVGVIWPQPWRLYQKNSPQEAAQLKVIWETPTLVNNSLMVRDDLPVAVVETIRRVIFTLTEEPGGSDILAAMAIAAFHPANDQTYAVVDDFIRTFEREVRPVEQP